MLAVNRSAPDFTLPSTNGELFRLHNFLGKNIILYFYPKDCTSGCTQEGKDFAEHYKKFASLNTLILGVSRDTLTLHGKFKQEQQFPFDLLSDVDQIACELYDVLKEKNLYGKKTRGVERSTFLIDKEGVLRREWRKVKVLGHVQEVLQAVGELD
jgi:peroxiredoxin Q/BCP